MSQPITFQNFGEGAILISWPNTISQQISEDIHGFNLKIQQSLSELIRETVTAYCSLTVYLKANVNQEKAVDKLKALYLEKNNSITLNPKTWDIPVCYDTSVAIDLKKLAELKNMSVDAVVKLHTKTVYTVDFLGFLPGFPYLNGLNSILHTKRLSTPRLSVAKGSVAIGGNQTGIYPVNSPGGWHIIGRTSVDFFNVNNSPACFIKALDKIKFTSISLDEFQNG